VPGFVTTVLGGVVAALVSWGLYGSGAGVELAKSASAGSPRAEISLTFSALAGALLVGVAGARWITNEVDKRLLKQSMQVAVEKHIPPEKCEKILEASPLKVMQAVQQA